MRFFYSDDKNSICDDIDFLCGSTSATYHPADKARNVNQEYQRVATLIWEVDGTWQFDDSRNAGESKATRTIAHASAIYEIPTTALRIEGVEVKDVNGDWYKLAQIDYQELTQSPEEYMSTPGMPTRYDLDGNNIRLFPPPHSAYVTLNSGLCVRLSRNVSGFTSASTASPGFAEPFHRILSIAAAMDFTEDPVKRNFLLAMRDRIEKGLVRFYSKRNVEGKTRIVPSAKRRWRTYL